MHTHTHTESVWSTDVIITVDSPCTDAQWEAARDEVVAFLHHVDAVFSTFKPESLVTQLRTGRIDEDDVAGAAATSVAHADLHEVIGLCRKALIGSRGAYDPWAAPGGFDPSGLVKGWAAQRAIDMLVRHGFTSAFVNAGGDIATVSDGEPWSIGISDPDEPAESVAVVHSAGAAVCTSGTYERGEHVVDPRSRAHSTGARSATVVGPDAALADAYATAICVDGVKSLDWFTALGPQWSLFIVPPGSRTGYRYGDAFSQ